MRLFHKHEQEPDMDKQEQELETTPPIQVGTNTVTFRIGVKNQRIATVKVPIPVYVRVPQSFTDETTPRVEAVLGADFQTNVRKAVAAFAQTLQTCYDTQTESHMAEDPRADSVPVETIERLVENLLAAQLRYEMHPTADEYTRGMIDGFAYAVKETREWFENNINDNPYRNGDAK